MTKDGRHAIDIVSRMVKEDDNTITGVQAAETYRCQIKLVQVGQNLTIVGRLRRVRTLQLLQLYNKGPYMVVAKEDIKTAGRKV